jgi:hypothetical protein
LDRPVRAVCTPSRLVTSRKWIAGIGVLRDLRGAVGAVTRGAGPRVDTLAFLSSAINID